MSSANQRAAGSPEQEERKMSDDVEDLGKAAKGAAEEAGERLREEYAHFREEMAAETSKISGAAADEAYRFAEGRKTAAAEAMHDLAHSVRDSARAFEDRPNLQAFFDSAAEGLDSFAGTIHDRSFAQLYADAEHVARERPITVAVGAGLLGLFIARLARSSGLRARLEEERYEAERRWAEQESRTEANRGTS